MASVAPLGTRWKADLVTAAVRGMSWFIPVLVAALLSAWLSYTYNQKANRQLVDQQQRISDLQQFRQSASQLDQSLSGLSDALVDGKMVDESRREMRQAITRNLSDAIAASHVLGKDINVYVAGLADLRITVDRLGDVRSGQELWQKSINLIEVRRRMVADAQKRAVQ